MPARKNSSTAADLADDAVKDDDKVNQDDKNQADNDDVETKNEPEATKQATSQTSARKVVPEPKIVTSNNGRTITGYVKG